MTDDKKYRAQHEIQNIEGLTKVWFFIFEFAVQCHEKTSHASLLFIFLLHHVTKVQKRMGSGLE